VQNIAKSVVAPIFPVAAGVGIADENGGDMPGILNPVWRLYALGGIFCSQKDLPAIIQRQKGFRMQRGGHIKDPRTERWTSGADRSGADMAGTLFPSPAAEILLARQVSPFHWKGQGQKQRALFAATSPEPLIWLPGTASGWNAYQTLW
jgi:hypothetical protein